MQEKVEQIQALSDVQLERSIIDAIAYHNYYIDNIELFEPKYPNIDSREVSKRKRLEAVLYTLQMGTNNHE